MSLEHLLLGMLRTPSSGYDLRKCFEQSVRHVWSAELSQIYPALARMTRRGWLKKSVEASRRGPARRVYATSPAGRAELKRWINNGPIIGTERFAYLAQLYFMDELQDPVAALSFIEQLKGSLLAWRGQLQAIEAAFMARSPQAAELSDEEFYPFLTLRMGLRALAAKVEWCDEVAHHLRRREQHKGRKS